MSRKIVELNEYQTEAVTHVFGACFVGACPGSGKTRVIVERCARLIEEEISPRNILCITFTNKAANEMRERLHKMIGEQAKEVYISTFHALCAEILRKYGGYIGYDKNLSIVTDDDQEALITQAARQLGYEPKPFDMKKILWACNNARENLCEIDGHEFEEHFKAPYEAQIAREYLARLRQNNQIDFSGLLSETIRLLQTDKNVLQKLQDRFEFIQVDEAQDTNLAQFRIVEMLGEHTNVFMVGDGDQCIYEWRGARFDNIEDFITKFSARVVHLPVNYRSTKAIVEAAGRLIKHNKKRDDVDFETVNDEGEPIECWSFHSPDQEGEWIAREIASLIRSGRYKANDFAILYRNNAMSRALEAGLVAQGVSYQVIGGFSFFDRKEIKDALAMLRFLANPKDGIALARFINKPSRRIGQATIAKIEKFAIEKKVSLVDALKRADEYISGTDALKIKEECKKIGAVFSQDFTGVPLGEIMSSLVSSLDYVKYLEEDTEDDNMLNRVQNLEELFTSASAYSSKKPGDIVGYLNKIALQSSTDKEAPEGAVALMTIHAAKGLEFPVVFMPCCDEGSLPSQMSLNERGNDAEEERRLCYVGMTRAKKKLYMTYPKSRPKRARNGGLINVPTKPSRFFKEAGLEPEQTY